MLRLIRLLRRTMRERTRALAPTAAPTSTTWPATASRCPASTSLIDNLPALVESLESAGGVAREHVEQLQTCCRTVAASACT